MGTEDLREKIIARIKTVFDPEIPVDIYELGLIYEIQILPLNNVQIEMTLTSPSCPAAQTIPVEVENKVKAIEGVNSVHVSIVWNPPWDRDMMSEVAKLELGML